VRLSPQQKIIVVMVGRDGLSWAATADSMQIHESTVRAHVARILRKFGSTRRPREAMTEIYWRRVAAGDDTA
jgi:DNA-binding CsgD family transcriptional regulator